MFSLTASENQVWTANRLTAAAALQRPFDHQAVTFLRNAVGFLFHHKLINNCCRHSPGAVIIYRIEACIEVSKFEWLL